MRPDDETLVRQCLEGSREAFESLLERYEKKVFNVAFRMLGNHEEARDVTQSVFLKAYEKLGGFDDRYRFYSWIYRIAINESVNLLNSRKQYEAVNEYLPCADQGPGEFVDEAELSRAVQGALMALKPDHRTAIVLRHYLECSYRDIGVILNVSEKTVKSRLFTARQQLKDALSIKGILKT